MHEVVACFDELFGGDVSCFAERRRTCWRRSDIFSDVGEGRVEAVHLVKHVDVVRMAV